MVKHLVTHDAKIKLCQLWVTHCFSQVRLNSAIARRIVERFQNAIKAVNTDSISDDELICGLILVMEFDISEAEVTDFLIEHKAVSELHRRLDERGEFKEFIDRARTVIATEHGKQSLH